MGRALDVTGQRFGTLTAISRAPNHGEYTQWLLRCDCGATTIIRTDSLKSKRNSFLSGCGMHWKLAYARHCDDITGKRFGRLIALSLASSGKKQGAQWDCVCDCGSKKTVAAHSLKRGLTRSCGCLYRQTRKNKRVSEQHIESRKRKNIRDRIERLKSWRLSNAPQHQEELRKQRVWRHSVVANLSDSYIRELLTRGTPLSARDIPDDLTHAKRAYLKNLRELKKEKQS